jgi:hypothetical protein
MSRILTHDDTLTRAERERERERDAETVDDLIRLEGECDDAILVADSLAKEGVGVMLEVAGLLRHAKRLTVERLLRMETRP